MTGRYGLPAVTVISSCSAVMVLTAAARISTVVARTLLRLRNGDAASIEVAAVHRRDCGASRAFTGKGHEAEAARFSGIAICNDNGLLHITMCFEGLAQSGIGSVPAETSDIEFC